MSLKKQFNIEIFQLKILIEFMFQNFDFSTKEPSAIQICADRFILFC